MSPQNTSSARLLRETSTRHPQQILGPMLHAQHSRWLRIPGMQSQVCFPDCYTRGVKRDHHRVCSKVLLAYYDRCAPLNHITRPCKLAQRSVPVCTPASPLLPLLLPSGRYHGLHPLWLLHIKLCPFRECIPPRDLSVNVLNVCAMTVRDCCRPARNGFLELQGAYPITRLLHLN